jgi:hypothetical protein
MLIAACLVMPPMGQHRPYTPHTLIQRVRESTAFVAERPFPAGLLDIVVCGKEALLLQ